MRYNKCPICDSILPAHKCHTRNFRELTNRQQDNSIKMMTINLKKAIKRYAGNNNAEMKKILWDLSMNCPGEEDALPVISNIQPPR